MHLNVIQVAESLGVEESVVLSWVRYEGLPCVHDTSRMLFDRSEVAGWAIERGLAAKAGSLAVSTMGSEQGVNERGLGEMLRRGGIWRGVAPSGVQATIAKILANMPGVSKEIRQMLSRQAMTPDAITWAPIGRGFALPHLRSRVALGRDAGLVALLLLETPMEIAGETPDGAALDRLLFFVAPTPRAHLEILAKLSAGIARGSFGRCVKAGASDEQIFSALRVPDREDIVEVQA